jgi:beta-glucanase (GH16 family)
MSPRSAIRVVLALGLAGGPLAAAPPSKDYRPVWADEFDGERLDMTKWGYRGLGKRKKGVNVKEAVRLDGQGHLVITTRRVGDAYHTGMIGTQGKFETAFGYFECRVKFQDQPGHWSAFWLQSPTYGKVIGDPKACGTEIDIYEYLVRYPDVHHINLHWDGYGSHHKSHGRKHKDASLPDGWHVIGLEWTPDAYAFFLDGKEVWRTDKAVSHVRQYIILSMEVADWGGDIRKAKLPDSCTFDYVRVYRKASDATPKSK